MKPRLEAYGHKACLRRLQTDKRCRGEACLARGAPSESHKARHPRSLQGV